MSNDKINSVDVLSLDKHAKVSTVTLTHELGSEINETQLETLKYRRLTYLVPLKRAQDLVFSFFFSLLEHQQAFVSYSFLSFFLATLIFHILPNIRFWPNSDQSDQLLDHYSGTNDGGIKGHVGVTGVKKEVKKGSIFNKNTTPPTDYVALTCDLCMFISLTSSTKVIGLKNYQGSFGVTGVKSKNVIYAVWKIWK